MITRMNLEKIILASGAVLFLTFGWQLHVFFLYTADIYHKAKICESMNCIGANDMKEDLKSYDLPLMKGKK